MRQGVRVRVWPALAALVFNAFGAPCVNAHEPQPTPPAALRVAWEKNLGRDGAWTEFRAMSATRNGELLIGGSERNAFDVSASSATRLLLWRVDTAGAVISEMEIKRTPGDKGTNTAAIRDVVALDGGEALLLVDFEGGRPSLVRIDRTGTQIAREILAPGRAATLFKIVPSSGGNFLLIGHESFDALLIAVDASGAVQWEKKQDRGHMDLFVDGMATADGGFVLVGNSGDYDALKSGLSTVWIGRYDGRGEPKGELTFPGRYGKVARSRDNGYAAVYDRSGTNNQEIRLKGISPDLKEVWDAPVLTAADNFADFKVGVLPSDGFVLAGGIGGRPYVTTTDGRGRVTGTFQGEAIERSIDIGSYGFADVGNGSFVLASSNVDAREGKANVKQKVRVRRVTIR